jgi:hypothetical protein
MEDSNRTTQDLIAELEHNGEGHALAFLGIYTINGNTTFIRHDDPKRQQLLDEAVLDGGQPFAWFRVGHTDERNTMQCALLTEHKNKPAFQILLERTKDSIMASLMSLRWE